MIQVVPTVVFALAFTVNKLPIEVDLVRELLPQIHLAPLSPSRVSSAAAVIASCVPARRAVKSIP